MLPADQGLDTDHGTIEQIHLGLVVEAELFSLQGLTQHLQLFAVGLGLLVAHRIEEVVAIFASGLGGVHGLIGVAQQGVRIHIVLRIEADPDTGGDGQGRAGTINFISQRFTDAIQDQRAVIRIGNIAQQ